MTFPTVIPGVRPIRLHRTILCAVTLALILVASAFGAPSTVTFNLTGVSGGLYGDIYTSPYEGNINGGVTIPVICDDFQDESYVPETWTAYNTNLSTLAPASSSSTDTYLKWGTNANTSLGTDLGLGLSFSLNQTQEYDVAAYLITELLNPAGKNTNDLSFAIWGLFDNQAFSYVTGTDLTTAEQYLKSAIAAVGSPSSQASYSNVNIYTYVPGSTISNCGGCSGPPQEFIVVTTPEASTVVLMAIDLLGFMALVGFLRKRMSRSF